MTIASRPMTPSEAAQAFLYAAETARIDGSTTMTDQPTFKPMVHQQRTIAALRAHILLQREWGIRQFVIADEPWRPSLLDTGMVHGPELPTLTFGGITIRAAGPPITERR